MHTLLAALTATIAVWAQTGTEPKAKPEEYPHHATLGTPKGPVRLGVEYWVRTVPGTKESYYAGNYLVVEVAVYPPKGELFTVRGGDFQLKVNGVKHGMLPQSPGIVASAIRNPQWEGGPTVEALAGVGPGTVIYGPRRTGRFPGDPTVPEPGQRRNPETDAGPGTSRPDGVEATAEAIKDFALPEGPADTAVSGALYFPWRESTKKIKKIELVYDGPAGKTSFKLH